MSVTVTKSPEDWPEHPHPTKLCSTCDTEKHVSEFNKRGMGSSNPKGPRSRCRECDRHASIDRNEPGDHTARIRNYRTYAQSLKKAPRYCSEPGCTTKLRYTKLKEKKPMCDRCEDAFNRRQAESRLAEEIEA